MRRVLYRSGSDDVTRAFYSGSAKLLEYVASLASPFFITGVLNVRFDRPEDAATANVNELLASYGAVQHVGQPARVRGGILDVVVSGDDRRPTGVAVDDPGCLITVSYSGGSTCGCQQNLSTRNANAAWRNFDLASRTDVVMLVRPG